MSPISPSAHRTGSRSGFSLVEVLVALMIVSGIMLALTQLLEATRISRDTIHNIQETQLAGPAIMDLIERDLRGIMVYDRESDQALRVKNRVLLAGGGSQIKGLDLEIERQMKERLGGGKVLRIEEPVYGGANGALKIAHDMPGEYWEQLK